MKKNLIKGRERRNKRGVEKEEEKQKTKAKTKLSNFFTVFRRPEFGSPRIKVGLLD